ncbi:L-threonine ammonia-lyase-like [Liolophura sinensis]|uniref:L-threonine ammonia-lyase-like n=1 Tax=Liolophura sinensis TaxID=3198878 RepID=UPI003158D2A5
MSQNVTLSDIVAAKNRIQPYIRRTPLDFSPFLTKLNENGPNVFLKMESEQFSGSFKVRGAYNKLCVLSESDPELKSKGAVAASSGNHALGCTIAMKRLGIPIQVFTPENVSLAKKKMLEAYDANLVLHGLDVVDTEHEARRLSEEKGIPFISPYNDVDVVAGLGTIGMEIYEDLSEIDAVLVSVGGGGLISGIASYLKAVNPNVKVFGCQPELTKVMYESVKAGKIVFEESGDTLSDGTKGGIEDDSVTFELCRKHVDDWLLVTEEQISEAVYFMLDKHHKVVEGAAGAAVAAYTNNLALFSRFSNVAIVICGANMTSDHLHKIMLKYGSKDKPME